MRNSILLISSLFALALAGCESSTDVTITVGDTMAFDRTTIEAKPGSTVKVTLKSTATSAAMQHDFVLVKPGSDPEVASAGMSAGPTKDYLPDNPNILAHTKLLKPGESDTVTFKA